MVKELSPDLILLDVMMPGVDGFEVCRSLKQDEKTRVIPVVMVTTLREKEHREKAMNAGADDFLSKPVYLIELQIRTMKKCVSYCSETGTNGLGLAFCKLAIEAHEGKIWVESEGTNQGCTFSFTIPNGSNTETLL